MSKLPSLSRTTLLHLRAAEGWAELDSPAEALLELEAIAEVERGELPVLEMFWRVYVGWEKWRPAYDVAGQLVEHYPEEPAGWIDRAYALRRMKGGGLLAAFDALLPALQLFPTEPVIPYNLACYCAQLDKLDEALKWLDAAYAVGDRSTLLKMARNDPDLEPLRALGYLK